VTLVILLMEADEGCRKLDVQGFFVGEAATTGRDESDGSKLFSSSGGRGMGKGRGLVTRVVVDDEAEEDDIVPFVGTSSGLNGMGFTDGFAGDTEPDRSLGQAGPASPVTSTTRLAYSGTVSERSPDAQGCGFGHRVEEGVAAPESRKRWERVERACGSDRQGVRGSAG
jgi:hypothetical protein